jgi:hypothetical protein
MAEPGSFIEERATGYTGVFVLRAASGSQMITLLPGALEHHQLITAVREALERNLETPVGQWHDMEPGDLIQLTMHALGDLLDGLMAGDPHG